MKEQCRQKPYSVIITQETILFSGLIICLIGFLGLIIPVLNPVESVIGLLCCFCLSGYAVMSILFPGSVSVERFVTITGTVLISITLLTLGALVCEVTGKPAFSYGAVPSVTPYFTFIILLYTGALVLVSLIIVLKRSDRTATGTYPNQAGTGLFSQILFPITVALIIGMFIIAGVWILPSTQPAPVTELWLLTAKGVAGEYPSSIHAGENLTNIIGVQNEEGTDSEFLLVTRVNEGVAASRTFFIKNGEEQEFPISLDHLPGVAGEKVHITFDLYTNLDQNTLPYRNVSEVVRIV